MRGERDRYVARRRIGAADEHEERAGKRETKPGSLGGSSAARWRSRDLHPTAQPAPSLDPLRTIANHTKACLGCPMLRRHSFWFRALLMATDALLACGLLVVLSAWRFGSDWALWWREIVPEPTAFLALYAVGWVTILTANGLYRPRRGWSIPG